MIALILNKDQRYFYVLGFQRLRALFSDGILVSNHPAFSVS